MKESYLVYRWSILTAIEQLFQGFILEALLVTIFCIVHLRQETEDFEQPLIVPLIWVREQ